MRKRFASLISKNLAIPKLYGISVMGHRFSVYEYNKDMNTLLPPAIHPHELYMTDIAPAERWQYELLENDGEQALREIVAEIKEMCEAIAECSSIYSSFKSSRN